MSNNVNVLLLNLPSPPMFDIVRDYAGGFGILWPTNRCEYGQTAKARLHSFLPYASALLSKEGINYDILDCQRLQLNKDQVLREVKKKSPDIVFCVLGLPSLKKDLELVNMLKQALPNTYFVGLGTVCKAIPEEILQKSKIDLLLKNIYPNVSNIIKLVNTISQKRDLKDVPGVSYHVGTKVISTPESSNVPLSELESPKYDDIDLEGYEDQFSDKHGNNFKYLSILTGTGCPFHCFYCPYPLGFGSKWTPKSTNALVDEIEHLKSSGFEAFDFRDQSFVMDTKHTTEVCNELLRRKLDITWVCEARADQVSKDILSLMEKSGCTRIHYGVETGDPTLIKRAKPNTTLTTIRKAFKLANDLDLFTNAHIMLGWENETHESLVKTRKFIYELEPDNVNWNILTPYPGTHFHERAQKNNLILTNDWSKYTSHHRVMKTNLSLNELYTVKNRIIRDVSKRKMKKDLLNFSYQKKQLKLVIEDAKTIIRSYYSPYL